MPLLNLRLLLKLMLIRIILHCVVRYTGPAATILRPKQWRCDAR